MITRIQEKCQIIFHLSTALAGYLWEFTLRNSDWFIALFALIVIDQSNYFGIGIYKDIYIYIYIYIYILENYYHQLGTTHLIGYLSLNVHLTLFNCGAAPAGEKKK